jgi:hypothetical protein
MSLIPENVKPTFAAARIGARLLGGLFGCLLLGGCVLQQHEPGPEALNPTPIKTDQAMAKRLWSPSPANYVNDSVLTWPDYAPLQAVYLPYGLNFLAEPGLFLGNLLYIPAGVFVEPAWKGQTFKSQSPPPSYNLMPPLPKGAEPSPGYF